MNTKPKYEWESYDLHASLLKEILDRKKKKNYDEISRNKPAGKPKVGDVIDKDLEAKQKTKHYTIQKQYTETLTP